MEIYLIIHTIWLTFANKEKSSDSNFHHKNEIDDDVSCLCDF